MMVGVVKRTQGAQVDDLGVDARRRRVASAAVERLADRAAVRDERDVAAGPADRARADVDRRPASSASWPGQVVQRAVLEDEHRVGVGEGGPEHAAGVVEGGRREDAQPGDVGVPALQAVRVLRGELAAGAGGHPDHERYVELAAGHVQQRRRVVEDLVEGEQAEVDRHDLDDGPHAAQRGADAGADERRLRQRRVADALRAELLEQAEADAEAAAVAADVLAHEEDAVVAAQGLADAPRAWPRGRCVSGMRGGSRTSGSSE